MMTRLGYEFLHCNNCISHILYGMHVILLEYEFGTTPCTIYVLGFKRNINSREISTLSNYHYYAMLTLFGFLFQILAGFHCLTAGTLGLSDTLS